MWSKEEEECKMPGEDGNLDIITRKALLATIW